MVSQVAVAFCVLPMSNWLHKDKYLLYYCKIQSKSKYINNSLIIYQQDRNCRHQLLLHLLHTTNSTPAHGLNPVAWNSKLEPFRDPPIWIPFWSSTKELSVARWRIPVSSRLSAYHERALPAWILASIDNCILPHNNSTAVRCTP